MFYIKLLRKLRTRQLRNYSAVARLGQLKRLSQRGRLNWCERMLLTLVERRAYVVANKLYIKHGFSTDLLEELKAEGRAKGTLAAWRCGYQSHVLKHDMAQLMYGRKV